MAENVPKSVYRSADVNSRVSRDRGRFVAAVSEVDRFWSHVNLDPVGCWLWTNGTTKDGYPRFHIPSGEIRAYRYAYELLVGTIPDGLTLDHLMPPRGSCTSIRCVRPGHLEPVTNAENLRRMHERRRLLNGATR